MTNGFRRIIRRWISFRLSIRHLKFVIQQADGEDFRFETLAAAGIAKLRRHKSLEPVLGKFAFALVIQPLQIWNYAFERPGDFALLAGTPESEFNFSRARTPHQRTLEVFGQILVRSFEVNVVMAGNS